MRFLLNPTLDKEHFDNARSYWDSIHKKYERTSNKSIPRRTAIDGINIQLLPYIDVGVKLIKFDIDTIYGMRKITYNGEYSFVTFSYAIEYSNMVSNNRIGTCSPISHMELRLIDLNRNSFVFYMNGDLITHNDESGLPFKEYLNIDLPENYFEWTNDDLLMLRMCV